MYILLPKVSFSFFPFLTVLMLLQVLDEELRLNKCSSFELIEQYYLEKISHQVCFNLPGWRFHLALKWTDMYRLRYRVLPRLMPRVEGHVFFPVLLHPRSDTKLCLMFQKTLKHTRYGRISVKCYYDAPEQRLTVEILHAADIIALDANGKMLPVRMRYRLLVERCVFTHFSGSSSGLSDPFVIVEVCPHHLFPLAKSQRTQVKLKTLHPVFDELFYLWVLFPSFPPLICAYLEVDLFASCVFQPCQSWTVQTQVCLFDLHCDGLWLAFHQRLCRWSSGSSQRLLLAGETERLASRQERPACHSPPVSQ